VQDIFGQVNGRPLGNIAQSITINHDKAFIIINNAGKIEVVDLATFKSSGTIAGFTNPSKMIVINDQKAYVSDWNGNVYVVNINNLTISKSIASGTGPDGMLKLGSYAFVANTGGLGIDSTVNVIDCNTDQIVKTIKTGDAPDGLVSDANGKLWVLCKGKGYNGYPVAGDTYGKLLRINPLTFDIEFTFTFPDNSLHPEKLVTDKQKSKLYFLYNNGVYTFDTQTETAEPQKLINRSFYSLDYEAKTGYLYTCDVQSYTSNGQVLRYNAANGNLIDSIPAGIIPRAFAFTE
jgi:DNA-binding beta-propeller fold protein YncE